MANSQAATYLLLAIMTDRFKSESCRSSAPTSTHPDTTGIICRALLLDHTDNHISQVKWNTAVYEVNF